jgi:hypothetical protein
VVINEDLMWRQSGLQMGYEFKLPVTLVGPPPRQGDQFGRKMAQEACDMLMFMKNCRSESFFSIFPKYEHFKVPSAVIKIKLRKLRRLALDPFLRGGFIEFSDIGMI